MSRSVSLLCVGLLALTTAGCTWVSIDDSAEGVRIATSDEVTGCRKVSNTSVQVMSKFLWIGRRSEKKMGKELGTLARNEAAKQGADTVVATSGIESGSQDFALYECGTD